MLGTQFGKSTETSSGSWFLTIKGKSAKKGGTTKSKELSPPHISDARGSEKCL